MDTPQPIDARSLLEHTAWVKRLARSLVADPNAADDLVQDTWVSALQHPPRHGANLRGWLAGVLRNTLRQRDRGELRRRDREERSARGERAPGTLDVIARASMHKELVDHVMALSEPFRTTVLLRFFDELPPREIALHLGIPVHTVNSRLQRGIAELRERLDRGHGDRTAWMSALLPLASDLSRHAAPSLVPPLGALVMNAKWKVAVVLVLALAGVIGMQTALDDERVDGVAASSSTLQRPMESERGAVRMEAPVTIVESAREPTTATQPEPRARAAPAVATEKLSLRGRVIDTAGRPIAGVRIAFVSSGGRATRREIGRPAESTPASDAETTEALRALSDHAGAFEMPNPGVSGELVIDQAPYTTLMAGLYGPSASIDPVVVAANARTLAGHVYDESGAPIASAMVRFELERGFTARFSLVLDASRERKWSALTGPDGAFELADAPRVEGSRLRTARQGYIEDRRDAPDHADRAIAIVLARAPIAEHHLAGDVRAPDGSAVEGAHVALGLQVLVTDANGAFDFDLQHGDGESVVAVKAGYAPAELRASATDPRWPPFARLTLGTTPMAMAGRVVDSDGSPMSGARVWLADPTFFGDIDGDLTHVEHLLAANADRGGEPSAAKGETNPPDLFWSWFRTDSKGRFRIEGLSKASYRVKALDPRSLVEIEEGPFASGATNVELRFPESAVYERVDGRVISRRGETLGGLQIKACRTVMKVASDTTSSSYGHSGATTTTDAEGRFVLANVARDRVLLAVSGDRILPTWFDLPEPRSSAEPTLTGVEITATRRCHLQVELTDRKDRADAFVALDASGTPLSLVLIRGDHEWSDRVAPLSEGRSSVLAVAEDAETLVLLLKTQEVERVPIAITPERVNVIRP